MDFIFPWGTFSYRNLPFGLKNVGATFQHGMSYSFHDIKHIMEPYLDDLPSHLKQEDHHVDHLRAIFLRCRHIYIRLNPHKCIFYVDTGWLLGFIVSKDGIHIDPLLIEAILALPAPKNITELQNLQGKEIFLRCFVYNYTKKNMVSCIYWRRIPLLFGMFWCNMHSIISNMLLHMHLFCNHLIIPRIIPYFWLHPFQPLVWF